MKHHFVVSLFSLFSLSLALTAVRPAHAELPAERAASYKQRGDEAMMERRYADALAAYETSYSADTSPRVLFNIGRAHEMLGDYPHALLAFERFERDAPPELRARVPTLGTMIESIRARCATLDVRTTVRGATVLVRNRVLAELPENAPLPTLRVLPGWATIEVRKDGYVPFRREMELPAGATTVVDAQLKPIPVKENAAKKVAVTPIVHPQAGRSPQRVISLVVGGAGLAALGVATIVALDAKSRYSDASNGCVGNECDLDSLRGREAARDQGDIASYVAIGGAALVATGIVLWATAPTAKKQTAMQLGISPRGLIIGGAF